MHVLDIDQYRLVSVHVPGIRRHLQQVPAIPLRGAAPIAAGQMLAPGAQDAFEIIQMGETQEPVYVIRMYDAFLLKLLQPLGESILLAVDGPFLRPGLHHLIAVLAQVHPQYLAVDIAELVHMGGQRDDESRYIAFPQHPLGLHIHGAQDIVA